MTTLDEEKDFDEIQDKLEVIKHIKEFLKDSLMVLEDLKIEYINTKQEYNMLVNDTSLAKRKDELYGQMAGLNKAIKKLEYIIDKLPNPKQKR